MKKTCRPLSRFSAKSRQRAGWPSRPGAARLLVVGLDRARDGLVADRPHVGLVDPHAERVGGDDHRRLAGHEPALDLRAALARQARVVDEDLLSELGAEPLGERLAALARPAVDDRRERARRGERRPDPRVLVRARAAADDREGQVRPVEAGGDPHRVAQPEAPHDVAGHLRRRGRRRREDRARAEVARRVGEAEVVGPEVVAPLGDAVRLVDDEQAHVRAAQPLGEARRREALGRDVEQPQVTGDRPCHHLAVDRGVLLRVDQRHGAGRDLGQAVHLVLHQRDERRDDDGQVVAHERRQLVAERLPAPVGMTTRTSRPPIAASTASRWPGRKASKPKCSERAVARVSGTDGHGIGAVGGSGLRVAVTCGSCAIA